MVKPARKLELHYYFGDNSHSMNAILRNECEREILTIFKDIATTLDIQVEIESEAFLEGGLKEWWSLLGKNGPQVTLIITILAIYLSRHPVENKELVALQMENLRLDNEIKKRELIKVTNELKSDDEITSELVDKVVGQLNYSYKLIWHKSNFYKKLSIYPKVIRISTQKLDSNDNPTDNGNSVEKRDFYKFIIRSDKFPPTIDEEAIIDLISPVLTKGNFHWKGIYKGQVISFEMKDDIFKQSVLNKQIEFANGFAIKCVLQQNRKIDELGNIQITSNQVLTVLEIIEGGRTIETEQGINFKKDKADSERQLKLDL